MELNGDFGISIHALDEHQGLEKVREYLRSVGADESEDHKSFSWRESYDRYDKRVREIQRLLDDCMEFDSEEYLIIHATPRTWCGSCAEPYLAKLFRVLRPSQYSHLPPPRRLEERIEQAFIDAERDRAANPEPRRIEPVPREEAERLRRMLIEGAESIDLL